MGKLAVCLMCMMLITAHGVTEISGNEEFELLVPAEPEPIVALSFMKTRYHAAISPSRFEAILQEWKT